MLRFCFCFNLNIKTPTSLTNDIQVKSHHPIGAKDESDNTKNVQDKVLHDNHPSVYRCFEFKSLVKNHHRMRMDRLKRVFRKISSISFLNDRYILFDFIGIEIERRHFPIFAILMSEIFTAMTFIRKKR